MMKSFVRVCVALLLVSVPAFAHRLDELLQATLISVGRDRVHLQVRLAPGVSVVQEMLRRIDANRDGVLSNAEQRAYAESVLRDVSLTVDGERLAPQLVSWIYPSVDFLKEGMGNILIELDAPVTSRGGNRTLTFENHFERERSVYLVNAESPVDPSIHIASQNRNYTQSFYRLDYSQAGTAAAAESRAWWPDAWSTFASTVPLGMRHIAEGKDHLLFLLALLLPAPFVAVGRRWVRHGSVRYGALRLLRVVTAFTIGHSITLGLAATNVVRAPVRPVEFLIAVSIFVTAIHAIRPIFPGREAWVAGGFGLVHGLAFATMIAGYGIDPWHTTLTVAGFNVGIELMQAAVLLVAVPWLLVMAQSRACVVSERDQPPVSFRSIRSLSSFFT
jgi:hypothetical protein